MKILCLPCSCAFNLLSLWLLVVRPAMSSFSRPMWRASLQVGTVASRLSALRRWSWLPFPSRVPPGVGYPGGHAGGNTAGADAGFTPSSGRASTSPWSAVFAQCFFSCSCSAVTPGRLHPVHPRRRFRLFPSPTIRLLLLVLAFRAGFLTLPPHLPRRQVLKPSARMSQCHLAGDASTGQALAFVLSATLAGSPAPPGHRVPTRLVPS